MKQLLILITIVSICSPTFADTPFWVHYIDGGYKRSNADGSWHELRKVDEKCWTEKNYDPKTKIINEESRCSEDGINPFLVMPKKLSN